MGRGRGRRRSFQIPKGVRRLPRSRRSIGRHLHPNRGVSVPVRTSVKGCPDFCFFEFLFLAHRASASSHAPSSYHRKRARLSVPSDSSNPPSRPSSRNATMSSVQESPNAKSTGSWSSRKSAKSIAETLRRAASASTTPTHARNDSMSRSHSHTGSPSPGNAIYQHGPSPSRRSLSQASIPISALISPHAPSITHSGTFHMRDPRRPAPVQITSWTLSFPSRMEDGESRWERGSWVERGGSPLCAWFFFIGFVVFPLWWIASFTGVPRTRRLPGGEAGGREKGVILDDPQVEYG